ncbi:hypothetical protein CJD36_003690 [Flavipsychrobacter stenotrophus]|uniref:Uncharacterized protein n=1 Tax=Flavipsychrobacter stenotrophus TaxID=2077091 RepID=A0A2S7T1Y1_9BACT|nr:hypothetical protein [Flavipsychrobacter stenotrophus]PQJ12857.1 hypothetical protein CJD36_003690 [Flavipsychrobacter stenotrophus]
MILAKTLLGKNIAVKYAMTVDLYDGVNGNKIGILSSHAKGDYATVVELKTYNVVTESVLWMRLEDPEQQSWVMYVDGAYEFPDGRPIIVDYKSIEDMTASVFSQAVDMAKNAAESVLPEGMKDWFSKLSDMLQKGIVVAAIGAGCFIIYKIYKKIK